MSAAGVGRLSRSATRFVAKQASGYHLLRIDGYSQTKAILPGQNISSMDFRIGGHSWRVDYYPRGRDTSAKSDAVSVYLQLLNHNLCVLQAQYRFSLLDHAGIASYELPHETASFTSIPELNPAPLYSHFPHRSGFHRGVAFGSPAGGQTTGPGCGHDDFIRTQELESRENLIRNDCLMVRCDVSVTEMTSSCLATDEITYWEDKEEDDDDPDDYESSYGIGGPPPSPRRLRHRRPDGEYVKWCLAQAFK